MNLNIVIEQSQIRVYTSQNLAKSQECIIQRSYCNACRKGAISISCEQSVPSTRPVDQGFGLSFKMSVAHQSSSSLSPGWACTARLGFTCLSMQSISYVKCSAEARGSSLAKKEVSLSSWPANCHVKTNYPTRCFQTHEHHILDFKNALQTSSYQSSTCSSLPFLLHSGVLRNQLCYDLIYAILVMSAYCLLRGGYSRLDYSAGLHLLFKLRVSTFKSVFLPSSVCVHRFFRVVSIPPFFHFLHPASRIAFLCCNLFCYSLSLER